MDIQENIRHILENPQEGKEMVERGKRQIMENLAWGKVRTKVDEVYEDCYRPVQ